MVKKLSDVESQVINLLKKSLWNDGTMGCPMFDWQTISKLSKEQGITSFVYDGTKHVRAEIPSEINQQWKSYVLTAALRNERLMIAQDAVVRRFQQAEIPLVVLKGSSAARYYPQPELRVLGDIDILVRKRDVRAAEELLLRDGYEKRESEHGFHSGFSKNGVYLELHEQVTNFPDTPGGHAAQAIADGFLDRVESASMCGYTFPVLSRADQAVSLLLHMVRHMFEGGIGLRQLCDWMVFVAAEGAHFTDDVCPVLEHCGLLEFAQVSTKTCVQYLGLDPACCRWCEEVDEQTCALFVDGVFGGGNMGRAAADTMGSLFTDEKTYGENTSAVKAFVRRMNRLVYKNFPFVERCRILLPLFWLYLPIRYLLRSAVGLRPKKALGKTVGSAKRQRDLFEELRLFEI